MTVKGIRVTRDSILFQVDAAAAHRESLAETAAGILFGDPG
jgi:hypothetical protein